MANETLIGNKMKKWEILIYFERNCQEIKSKHSHKTHLICEHWDFGEVNVCSFPLKHVPRDLQLAV